MVIFHPCFLAAAILTIGADAFSVATPRRSSNVILQAVPVDSQESPSEMRRRDFVVSVFGATVLGNVLPATAATSQAIDSKSTDSAATTKTTTATTSQPTDIKTPTATATATAKAPPAKMSLPNPGDTKNCSDFKDYKEAKPWYDTYFPLYGDVAKLDADKDGIPCESLPGAPKRSNNT
jgi:hypothetical protein